MVLLIQNMASARHAASADQCNAWLQRPLATKFKIPAATVYRGITAFIDSKAARARRLREVARTRPIQAPDSGAGADADGTCPSAVGSPKRTELESKPEVLAPNFFKLQLQNS